MEHFPIFTVGFIIVMDSIVAFIAWLILARTLEIMPDFTRQTKRRWQVRLALGFVGWFLVVGVLSALGFTSVQVANGLGIFIIAAVPLIVAVLSYVASPTVRAVVDRIPHWQVLAIQVFRNMGFVFLILLDLRLIPREFALPAGFGDILVGMLAPIVTVMYLSKRQGATLLVIALHVLGLLDFISAFGTAALIADASAFSPEIVPYMMLIPGFAVPIFAIMHLISIRKLIAEANALGENHVLASVS